MSDESQRAVGSYEPTTTISEDKLVRKLEKEASRITGEKRSNFVDSKSLCTSCQNGIITRVADQNHREIYCQILGRLMPDNVSECSVYFSVNSLSLSQMVSIAHLIEVRGTNQGYM